MQSPPTEELGIRGPPPGVKGMAELDRDAFTMKAVFPALEIDAAWMNVLMKPMKSVRYMHKKLDRLTPVTPSGPSTNGETDNGKDNDGHDPSPRKLLLLDPDVAPDFATLRSVLESKSAASFLELYKITKEHFKYHVVDLHYDFFNAEQILTWILPDEVGPATGFSQCGHIVHLNLKEHHLPYKKLIGQVILDKIVAARTVVNKTAQIHSVYRNFEFEVLAGEDNLETTTKEGDCSFELDFGKVYWNSRLSTEHERVVKDLPEGAVVYDIFAGIGPFAIPAAKKKKCRVYANDLNPESYKWLKRNVEINSSKKIRLSDRIDCFNLDGRDFLRQVVIPDVARRILDGGSRIAKKEFFVVMNLPAIAIEFLNVLPGCLDAHLSQTEDVTGENEEDACAGSKRPFSVTVYCYCFSNADDVVAHTRSRVEAVLGTTFGEENCQIRNVRNVAPKKEMMVAKVRLTSDVLLSKNCEPMTKRQKVG